METIVSKKSNLKIVNSKLCIECKNKNIRCKNLCAGCYSKMYRRTDKGKELLKAYNNNAGKEARKRFLEKANANKPPKPPKPPKTDCECGKPSKSKNLCNTCYNRLYQRERNGWKTGLTKTKIDKKKLYEIVLFYVKNGYTILNACKKAGYKSSSNLYRTISPIQKAELLAYKKLGIPDEEFGFI